MEDSDSMDLSTASDVTQFQGCWTEACAKPLTSVDKKKHIFQKWWRRGTAPRDVETRGVQTRQRWVDVESFDSLARDAERRAAEEAGRRAQIEAELRAAREELARARNEHEAGDLAWQKEHLERDNKISSLKKQVEKWEQEACQWREYAQSLIQYEKFLDQNLAEPVTSHILAARKKQSLLDNQSSKSSEIVSIRQKLQLEIVEKANYELRNKIDDLAITLNAKNEQLDRMAAQIDHLQRHSEESIGFIQAEMAKCFAWFSNKKEEEIFLLWSSYLDSKSSRFENNSSLKNVADGDAAGLLLKNPDFFMT